MVDVALKREEFIRTLLGVTPKRAYRVRAATLLRPLRAGMGPSHGPASAR